MKKAAASKMRDSREDELRPEYQFDYTKASPNRFADQPDAERLVVVLDPDVSEVFKTPDSVNAVLRALIETMPMKSRRKATSA